jgi:outer membrane protein assembly factor BamB
MAKFLGRVAVVGLLGFGFTVWWFQTYDYRVVGNTLPKVHTVFLRPKDGREIARFEEYRVATGPSVVLTSDPLGVLRIRDGNGGAELHRFTVRESKTRFSSILGIDDRQIVSISKAGELELSDWSTGKLRWRLFGRTPSPFREMLGPGAVLTYDSVYAFSQVGERPNRSVLLERYDRADGRMIWSKSLGSSEQQSPRNHPLEFWASFLSIDQDRLFVASWWNPASAEVFNAADGSQIGAFKGPVKSIPVAGKGLVAIWDGTVLRVSETKGMKQRWATSLDPNGFSGAVVSGDSLIVSSSDLRAYELATGKLLWTAPYRYNSISLARGTLFGRPTVILQDGPWGLLGIDPSTGSEIWKRSIATQGRGLRLPSPYAEPSEHLTLSLQPQSRM